MPLASMQSQVTLRAPGCKRGKRGEEWTRGRVAYYELLYLVYCDYGLKHTILVKYKLGDDLIF